MQEHNCRKFIACFYILNIQSHAGFENTVCSAIEYMAYWEKEFPCILLKLRYRDFPGQMAGEN